MTEWAKLVVRAVTHSSNYSRDTQREQELCHSSTHHLGERVYAVYVCAAAWLRACKGRRVISAGHKSKWKKRFGFFLFFVEGGGGGGLTLPWLCLQIYRLEKEISHLSLFISFSAHHFFLSLSLSVEFSLNLFLLGRGKAGVEDTPGEKRNVLVFFVSSLLKKKTVFLSWVVTNVMDKSSSLCLNRAINTNNVCCKCFP